MPRGDKSKYTEKQKRQVEHIEEGYRDRGVPADEAEARSWATVNKMTGGGKKSGSGRGKEVDKASAKKAAGRAERPWPEQDFTHLTMKEPNMNNTAYNKMYDGEIPIYEAVKYLPREELDATVRRNAAAMNFELTDEHMNVIHSLVEHYKQDCAARDCLAAHEQMRFLEEAYAFKGGSKYLYMLFDAVPGTRGVLMPIHELAGLPALQLETDEGFGTAF